MSVRLGKILIVSALVVFLFKLLSVEFQVTDVLCVAHESMASGESPIIIDNTNCVRWEMKPYVKSVIVSVCPISLLYRCPQLNDCVGNAVMLGLESVCVGNSAMNYHWKKCSIG